jgi:hypothetical protein
MLTSAPENHSKIIHNRSQALPTKEDRMSAPFLSPLAFFVLAVNCPEPPAKETGSLRGLS